MDAVSYPESSVVQFISENLIPLRIQTDTEPYVSNFKLRWTPTLIILDPRGEERQRTVGFLQPEELIPALLLGIGKVDFDMGCYVESIERFNRIITDYPDCEVAPEAVYLRGVANYKKDGTPQALKEAYEKLGSDYPGSIWAKRSAPYRLL
ncbi:MAG: hypothetical protein ACLFV2_05635 [Desulfurivibrionaceae bacterium]